MDAADAESVPSIETATPPPMDVAVGYTLPRRVDTVRAIEWADDHAYDFVEVVMHGALGPDSLADGPVPDALAETDLDATIHLPMPVDIGSPFDPVRDGSVATIERCLDVAAALPVTVRTAVLHPTSAAPSGRGWAVDIEARLIESVATLADHAASVGIDLSVENLYRNEFPLAGFEPLFETEASVCVDTGHARVEGLDETEIAAFLDDHGERVSHFHLNDVRGRTRSVSDEHLPFGAGDTDFETMFAPLADGWSGTMDLEVSVPNLRYMNASRAELARVLAAL